MDWFLKLVLAFWERITTEFSITPLRLAQILFVVAFGLTAWFRTWIVKKTIARPKVTITPTETNPRLTQFDFDIPSQPFSKGIVRMAGWVLQLSARNRSLKIPGIKEIVYPVTECEGSIDFVCPCDGKSVALPMPVRWAQSPEPIAHGRGLMAVPSMIETKRKIAPGNSETIDVVVRFEGQLLCYGWTNESHIRSPFLEEWKLESHVYKIRVVLKSPEGEWKAFFRLVNRHHINRNGTFEITDPLNAAQYNRPRDYFLEPTEPFDVEQIDRPIKKQAAIPHLITTSGNYFSTNVTNLSTSTTIGSTDVVVTTTIDRSQCHDED